MNVTRQKISDALLAQLNTANYQFAVPGTRRERIWSDQAPTDQPCWFLLKLAEATSQNSIGLPKYTLHYRILVYAQIDMVTENDPTIDAILDAFDVVLQNTPQGEKQTLGGLVNNAWIDGETLVIRGSIEQQIAIWIPIKVESGL